MSGGKKLFCDHEIEYIADVDKPMYCDTGRRTGRRWSYKITPVYVEMHVGRIEPQFLVPPDDYRDWGGIEDGKALWK